MEYHQEILSLVLGMLGITINLLLMIALCKTKRKWHRLNLQSVVPIAIFDFLAANLVVFKILTCFVLGNEELLKSDWYCKYFGASLQVLPVISVVLLGAMSADRYRIVVYGRGIDCFRGWVLISVLCIVTAGLKIANVAFYGLRPDPTATYCQSFGSGALTVVARYLSIFLFTAGVVVICFCYLSIYLCCRSNPIARRTLPRGFVFILIAYLICLLPKFITSVWRLFADQSTRPNWLISLAAIGFDLLLVANPCLVFAFQASLRKELQYFFPPTQLATDTQAFTEACFKPHSIA